ncbi:MAG: glycosyltransferase [Roseiflexus sp.]|nr:glycosyltransferase [Roseiflexus sp.]MCS7289987.1 glycosyltransferase [Roseiflexus sp.]MDW8233455.1 glycosyltransferase [Roseiflexaceae bacterium]
MNVYVRELSREFGRRGIPVDIFTRAQERNAPTIIQIDLGVRLIHVRAGPLAPYDKNHLPAYLPEFVGRVRCFADGEDLHYDIIHSHYWISGEAALALRRSWGAPVVHMFHTLGAMKNQVARGAEEQETRQRIVIEERILREADAIVAATPLDRAQMVWHYSADVEKIRVVPAGVDLRRFQPRDLSAARAALDLPPHPHRIVLLVARIEPLKGIDALIEACALLLRRCPEWRGALTALIVGGGSEEERARWNAEQRRLDAIRQRLGLTDVVRFVGAQPQDRLPLYYAAADVVTMPSHYESFGMAALEALACGRPVVATNAGGPAFIVEDGVSGLLIPPADPVALANHLERLLQNEVERAAMGAAARERALQFGWERVAGDVLGVYRDLLQQRSVRVWAG